MLRYVIHRILIGLLTIAITCVLIFYLQALFGRDPIVEGADGLRHLYKPNTPIGVIIDSLHEEKGFNDSITVRFFRWLTNIMRGDVGEIYSSPGTSITTTYFKPFRYTILVTLPALLFSYFFGVLLGFLAAHYRGRTVDRTLILVSNIFVGTPTLILATLILFILLAVGLPAQFRMLGSNTDSV